MSSVKQCDAPGCETLVGKRRYCPLHYSRLWRGCPLDGGPRTQYGRLSPAEKLRITSEVDEVTGCHVWQRKLGYRGYGSLTIDGKRTAAHRVAYEIHVGPIPDGMYVCHTCDNRACVNPAHLFLGTHNDNREDMVQKGRHARGSRHHRSKLTEAEVLEIRQRYAAGALQNELCVKFGVANSVISRIVNRLIWRHI